jgi:YidC/Oxa1 family membrane protein insertase
MVSPSGESAASVASAASTAPANDNTPPAAPTTATEQVDHATPLAEVPADSSELLPDIVNAAILNLPPALQYGDLAALGLVGWTPAGLIRWSLEVINVATGLPWFWTLVAGCLFWRAILVPMTIQSLRNSARILPLQPQMIASQEELKKIRISGDKLALQRHALKMRKMYSDAGVSMGVTALSPFVQLPVTLGLFFGVKKMCELPVVQLTHSGLAMLPDLTVPDPYMILPVLLCAAINVQVHVSACALTRIYYC